MSSPRAPCVRIVLGVDIGGGVETLSPIGVAPLGIELLSTEWV